MSLWSWAKRPWNELTAWIQRLLGSAGSGDADQQHQSGSKAPNSTSSHGSKSIVGNITPATAPTRPLAKIGLSGTAAQTPVRAAESTGSSKWPPPGLDQRSPFAALGGRSDLLPSPRPRASEDERSRAARISARLEALARPQPGAPVLLMRLPTYVRIQEVVGQKVRALRSRHAAVELQLDDWSIHDARDLTRIEQDVDSLEREREQLLADEDVFVALLDDLDQCEPDVVDELRPYFEGQARQVGLSALIWPRPDDAVDSGRHEVTSVEGPVLVTPLMVASVVGVGYIAGNGTTIRARIVARHRT